MSYFTEQVNLLLQSHEKEDEQREKLLAEYKREMKETEANFAEYVRTHPEPEPTILLGACPRFPGGTTLEAANRVGRVWGEQAVVRQFLGGISQPAYRPENAALTCHSWSLAMDPATATDAQLTEALSRLKPGDRVSWCHEFRVKFGEKRLFRGRPITKDVYVSAFNTFTRRVRDLRPDLIVTFIITGGEAFGWGLGTDVVTYWKDIDCDEVGLDLDGIVFKDKSYGDWGVATKEGRRLADTIAKKGLLCAPEVGTVLTPDDPTGFFRSAFVSETLQQLAEAGAAWACAYEYEPDPDPAKYTDAFEDEATYRVWKSWMER